MFLEAVEKELKKEKSVTTNGAIAYKTSGQALLDFNFAISGLRGSEESKIQKMFSECFYEAPTLAIKYLFYLGDVRGGLGERRAFNACMDWLTEVKPEIAKKVVHLIPVYSRWDNLTRLVDSKISDEVMNIIKTQIDFDTMDMNHKLAISLLGKWMQSENASSKETKEIGRKLRKGLNMTSKEYRQMLSKFRKYLDVVEVKTSSGKWDEIKYEAVPSRANLIYNKAFLKHDEQRRRDYLAALSKGETKINAGVLQPHEIAYRYRTKMNYIGGKLKIDVDQTLEELWKALPNLSIENTLVIRDGSGSMTWARCGAATPLDVATALSIYMSEHNSGEWKDKFITFSSSPEVVDLSGCESLAEKVFRCYEYNDCSNTDVYKTMKLILDTAVNNELSAEDMPKTIVICSDMQFDGRLHNLNKSLFDKIAKEFKKHGYKLPRICFWNLSGNVDSTIPMQKNDLGLILCSGFSVQILKMFMSGETDAYKLLVEQLNSERYLPVENALK